jgi:competence protein ComEA
MSYLAKLLVVLALALSQAVWAVPGDTVNVNTAPADVLAEMLDGVGVARARAIVEYREQYGEFADIEELLEVSGIGPRVLDNNRDRIVLTD